MTNNALRDSDDAPTIPAPACPEAESPPSLVLPRLTDRLYEEAQRAAAEFGLGESVPDSGLETLPPASAPFRIAPSFTVALLEIRRDPLRAEQALETVLARAPHLSEAHYYLGVLRLRRGDVDRAKHSFRLAVETLAETGGEFPAWATSLRSLPTD